MSRNHDLLSSSLSLSARPWRRLRHALLAGCCTLCCATAWAAARPVEPGPGTPPPPATNSTSTGLGTLGLIAWPLLFWR